MRKIYTLTLAVAAGAVAATAREVGDEAGVFIVGVRGDVKDAAHFAETAEFLQDR